MLCAEAALGIARASCQAGGLEGISEKREEFRQKPLDNLRGLTNDFCSASRTGHMPPL
jgi:hypothetical protein